MQIEICAYRDRLMMKNATLTVICLLVVVVGSAVAMEESAQSLADQKVTSLYQMCRQKVLDKLSHEDPASFNPHHLPQELQDDLLVILKEKNAWCDSRCLAILNRYSNGHTGGILSLAFSSDGQYLASGASDTKIKIWNMNNAQPQCRETLDSNNNGHINWVSSLAFRLDGKYLVSGAEDAAIILWNMHNATQPQYMTMFNTSRLGQINALVFRSDGHYLAAGSGSRDSDAEITIWDLHNIAQPQRVTLNQHNNGHLDGVKSLAFSPRGQYLVSGSWDKCITVWDMHNPAQPHGIAQVDSSNDGHTEGILSLAFSPNGLYLASGAADNRIKIWNMYDAAQPKCIATLGQHKTFSLGTCITSLVFSPDGMYLASGSDTNLTIWDMHNPTQPKCIATLTGNNGRIEGAHALAFSPNGQYLASGFFDGIKIWHKNSFLLEPCTTLQQALLVQFIINKGFFCFYCDERLLPLFNTLNPVTQNMITKNCKHHCVVQGFRKLYHWFKP